MRIALFFITVFLIGCDLKKNTTSDKEIRVNYIEQINLSELIDSQFEYVPLQTTSVPLIGSIHKVVATDSTYFVLDSQFSKRLFVFNKRGEFLRTIGEKGEGDGEYLNPSEVIVSKNNIEIVDGSNFSILRFNAIGEFEEEYRVPYWVNEAFQYNEDSKIIYCPTDYSPNGKVDMGVVSIVSNDFSKTLNSFFPYEEVLDDAPFPGFLSYHNDSFTYVKTILGEFYTINEKMEAVPRFKVDFGKHQWPVDLEVLKSDQEEVEKLFLQGGIMSIAHRLCENPDYLTFHTLMIDRDKGYRKIVESRDRWLCIFNKANEQLYAIKQVINDIDNVPFSFPIAVDNDYFVGVLSPELLHRQRSLHQDISGYDLHILNLMDTVNDTSNPILIKFKFRSDLFN